MRRLDSPAWAGPQEIAAALCFSVAAFLVIWSAVSPAPDRWALWSAIVIGLTGAGLTVGGLLRVRALLSAQKLAMSGAHDGLWMWDPVQKTLYVGERLLQLLGYDQNFLFDTHRWLEIVHPDDRKAYNRAVAAHLRGETDHFFCEYRVRTASGAYLWLAARGLARRDGRGVARLMAGSVSDITDRREQEERIRFLAHHDHLTSLPNRLLLSERVEQALTAARAVEAEAAMLFIDLDRFKNVNDSLGHTTGDQLLRAVAERLGGLVGADATVARQGGDEFIVLLPHVASEEAAMIDARAVVAGFRTPFKLGENEFFITASIGVALYPRDGHDINTLLRAADTAMYIAKRAGGDAARAVDAVARADVGRRLSLEYRLHRAVERQEFRLFYQAKAGVADNRLHGAEALLRWDQGDGTLDSPAAFIALAEETGQIEAIGDWVIATAARDLAAWRAADLPLRPIAVNLSPRQFRQPGLARRVIDHVENAGAPIEFFGVEVTESVLIDNNDAVLKELLELRAAGISVSLDDFGAGYSSLSYLRLLPVDTLKIDRSFIMAMTRPDQGVGDPVAIVRAVIEMGRALGLRLVAEGVETPAELALLRGLGCDLYQGYLFSKPIAESAYRLLLRERG